MNSEVYEASQASTCLCRELMDVCVNGMWGNRWRIDLMFPEDAVSAQGKKSWEKQTCLEHFVAELSLWMCVLF